MSVQLSPDTTGQFPVLVSPAANSNIDFPRAALRHAFVLVLNALDAAISAERDLGLALGDEDRGLFDPALQVWFKAAEDSWQEVKNLLVDLETAAIAVPNACSMSKMALCLDQIIGCDDPQQFQKHFQFAELLAHTASVIPLRTTVGRDSALIVRAAMERLDQLAILPNHHMDALGFDPSSRPIPGLEMYYI